MGKLKYLRAGSWFYDKYKKIYREKGNANFYSIEEDGWTRSVSCRPVEIKKDIYYTNKKQIFLKKGMIGLTAAWNRDKIYINFPMFNTIIDKKYTRFI